MTDNEAERAGDGEPSLTVDEGFVNKGFNLEEMDSRNRRVRYPPNVVTAEYSPPDSVYSDEPVDPTDIKW